MAAEAASLGAECGALEGRLLALRAAQPARAGPPPSAEQRAEQERLAEAAFEARTLVS